MSYIDRAVQVIKGAETALRDIIAQALTANAYGELSKVASVADTVAALIGELDAGARSTVPVDEPAGTPAIQQTPTSTQAAVRANPPAASRRNAYPRFLRDGDRLLKVAWSKKERQPYEHRAPQAVIQTLLNAIRQRKGEGKLFQAADVLPLNNANGEEYPSYQSYLALSWLRHVGIVTKKGREGYVLKKGAATPDQISRLWTSLPTGD